MRDYRLGACCAAIVWLFALSAGATEPLNEHLPSPFPTPSIPKQKIIVGITPGPPFNIHQSDGTWTGISVDLWREIASDLGLISNFAKRIYPGTLTVLPVAGLMLPSDRSRSPNVGNQFAILHILFFLRLWQSLFEQVTFRTMSDFSVRSLTGTSGRRYSEFRSDCSRSWLLLPH